VPHDDKGVRRHVRRRRGGRRTRARRGRLRVRRTGRARLALRWRRRI